MKRVHLNPVRAGLLKAEERLLAAGEHHFGQLRLETAEAKAERIVVQELGRVGWQESDLTSHRKPDPGKVRIALRLRQETTLSLKQIAQRLHFGTPKIAGFRLLKTLREQTSSNPAQGCLGI